MAKDSAKSMALCRLAAAAGSTVALMRMEDYDSHWSHVFSFLPSFPQRTSA